MSREDDLQMLGKTFGRWTVVSHAENYAKSRARCWYCRCACGSYRTILGTYLRQGRSQSCGCKQREELTQRQLIHGHGRAGKQSPTYVSWRNMLQRCANPHNTNYRLYGERGITVCDRWLCFENFLADMGIRPARYSIERINNAAGYFPENCRWATTAEQNSNQRKTHLITWNGETRHLAEWHRRTALPLQSRLQRGWSIERAFTEPLHREQYEETLAKIEMIW